MKQSSPSSGATPKAPLDLLANDPSLLLHLLLLVVIITGGLCLDSLFRVLSSSVRDWRALWSELLVASALAGVLGSYLWRMQRAILADRRRVVLLAAIIIAAGLAAKLIVPGHVLTPYLFPMAAATMLVAVLLDVQLAVVVGIILSLLVGFVGGKSLDLTVYTLVGSVIGALAVSPTGRLSTFAWAALAVGVVNSVVAVSFRLLGVGSDVVGLLELVGASLANGVLSVSLAFTTFFWLGTLLGITTPVQLVELARPTHPLAKRLLLEAPFPAQGGVDDEAQVVVARSPAQHLPDPVGAGARVGVWAAEGVAMLLPPRLLKASRASGHAQLRAIPTPSPPSTSRAWPLT